MYDFYKKYTIRKDNIRYTLLRGKLSHSFFLEEVYIENQQTLLKRNNYRYKA